MFTNFIFLILVLLLGSFAVGMEPDMWKWAPREALGAGLLTYSIFLGLIYIQNRILKLGKQKLLALVNVECLLFLAFFYFYLGAQRLLEASSFEIVPTLCSLLFYFGALTLFYLTARPPTHWLDVSDQIRLLFPFALPFLFFTLLVDLLQFVPQDNSWMVFLSENTFVALAFSFLFLGIMLLFLPPLIVSIWGCPPLGNSDLKTRLEALCVKAHFRHSGILTWGVMDNALTAAIIGILARFRYILFTRKLLRDFSPQAIEAILAHEIGHNYRRHLLLYPFIFLGLMVLMAIFSFCCEDFLLQTFKGSWLYPLSLFLPYALILGLYFRFVYGLFSRLFERQADLHVFALGVPAEAMIEALDHVGIGTGFTHLVPNWHHYSIQERIDFLKEAIRNPKVIDQHHKSVKRALLIYLLLLAVGIFIIFSQRSFL